MLREARVTLLFLETDHHFRAHCAPSTLYSHPLSRKFSFITNQIVQSIPSSRVSRTRLYLLWATEWPLVMITALISSFHSGTAIVSLSLTYSRSRHPNYNTTPSTWHSISFSALFMLPVVVRGHRQCWRFEGLGWHMSVGAVMR